MDTQNKACQISRLRDSKGFIAALDQSGGSTPSALEQYGVARDRYANEEEMFALVQAMRERIVTSPAFVGSKIIATILFERTMDSQVSGQPMPAYLWEERGILSFLKIDKGLAGEENGVQRMKPIPNLGHLLNRGLEAGVVGTKMRSVINRADSTGIGHIVQQQFELADEISASGLMPILEPEVSTQLPDGERRNAEQLLKQALVIALDDLPRDRDVILKLTIPIEPNFYESLINHPRVLRTLALSGGFSRMWACRRLRKNRGMIASFSRAFLEGLTFQMHEVEFEEALTSAINEIFFASVDKCL
jgi:fructose-bisphosphate aldolase class I